MLRHRSLSCAALLSCCLAACSLSDEAAEGQGSATRIDPNGTDVPGELLVVAPSDANGVVAMTVEVSGEAKPKALGETFARLSVGAKQVAIKTAPNGPISFEDTRSFEIASGTKTTVMTALLGVRATGGPATYGLGAEDDVYIGPALDLPPGSRDPAPWGHLTGSSDGSSLLPMFEGKYAVSYGLNGTDGVVVSLVSAETTVASLTDLAARRVTRVKGPARELPAAACGGAAAVDLWELSNTNERHGYYPADQSKRAKITLGAGEELDLGVSPKSEGQGYRLQHDMWSQALDVPLGERGAGPKVWALGAVDVDDVLIDGAKPRVPGTYAIFRADAEGKATSTNLLRCTPATNSGVPIAPGHYRVEVYYDTVEAGQKTDVHVIDVP